MADTVKRRPGAPRLDLGYFMVETAAVLPVCPRCNAEFHCGSAGPCWCDELRFRNARLKGQTGACVCQACLREIEKGAVVVGKEAQPD